MLTANEARAYTHDGVTKQMIESEAQAMIALDEISREIRYQASMGMDEMIYYLSPDDLPMANIDAITEELKTNGYFVEDPVTVGWGIEIKVSW